MRKEKNRKKNILLIIPMLFLVAGITVMTYPHICQVVYQYEADKLIREFEQRIEEAKTTNADDFDWLYQSMVAYNERLYAEKQKDLVDTFSYSQPNFSLMEFGFAEEMIGYLSIPQMNIRLPIYLGANQENMKKGAAHLTQTSLPIGGINTNAVIAAHRGMGTAAMFRDIEKLAIGDEITITNYRETLFYQVAEIKIIAPTAIAEVLIQPNRDIVTLVTCHPYWHNYQRYVVYCQRVESVP